MTNTTPGCPCGSQYTYSNCCEPLHKGSSIATTAEQLMRSRYSAFAHQQADYLLQTHHRHFLSDDDIASLKQSLAEGQWVKLNVLNHQDGSNDDTPAPSNSKPIISIIIS